MPSGGQNGVRRSPEIINEILRRIAEGETLRAICRDDHMPIFASVYDWLNDDNDFAIRFQRAREIGQEIIAQDCLDIADESGAEVRVDPKTGKLVVDGEVIRRANLRIDTRLKLLAKWNPKKWGEKKELDHKSSDGSMTPAAAQTPEEIAKRLAALKQKAQAKLNHDPYDASDLT